MAYEPAPVNVPRVAGGSLRLLVWLAESVLGGPLRRSLTRNAGIGRLRDAVVDETPAPWPDLGTGHSDLPPQPEWSHLAATRTRLHDFETAHDFVSAYTSGESTPLRVAEHVLAATRSSDESSPPLRLFIAQNAQDVLAMAQAATERYRAGESLGPLDGVPIAIKDEVDQVPYPTTVGRKFAASPPSMDSAVVERLRAAGAVLIGKANMTEIAIGVTGLNVHHGAVRNPHDPTRISGGSSSGPAAAVAAGLCPAALGGDGGGSIRTPASFCGVVGLKPTFGRVSEIGAAPLCWSVAHLGPLASTVRDAALVYALLAGPDSRDPNTLAQPAPRWDGLDAGVGGMRIGIFRPWFEHADPDVVDACMKAVERLQREGAQVIDVAVDDLELIRVAHLVTIGSEMTAAQRGLLHRHRRHYAHDVRLLFSLVETLTGVDYVTAQRVRRQTCRQMRRLFSNIDVLATPATATTASAVPADALSTGESNLPLLDRIMRFATLANLTGYPAISFPAGYDRDGLPTNLQLMGRPWDEHLLLRAAFTAEQSCARRIPRVHYRLLN